VTPSVSVIINCLNGAAYLREAIDSVFAQTFDDWEIIFWDNASSDDSAAIARSYGPRVRAFSSESTVPLGQARNRAIEHAAGRFIAFLDADDVWHAAKLAEQMPLFDDARVGLVYSDARLIDASGSALGLFSEGDPVRLVSGRIRDSLLAFGGFLCLSTAVIRRSVLDRVGGFDPQFNIVEDTDLWFRIAGVSEARCCPGVLADYRVHASSTLRTQRERHCREALTLTRREVARGDMSAWARRQSAERVLGFTEDLAGMLIRRGDWREAASLLAAAAGSHPSRAAALIARKVTRVVTRSRSSA